jgi:hypothetical protein
MLRAPRLLFLAIFIVAGSFTALAQQTPPAAPTIAPSPSLAKDSRFYELRTYYAAPGKLEDLHARFRNHTIKLFKKHGINVVGFWGPTDKEKGSENTLIYLLSYASREARADAWKAFGADPAWQAARKKSEENGRLVEKVDYVFLMSTDYAPVK